MATNYRFGPFRLDADAEVLFRGTEVTGLGRRPIALLRVLVQQAGAPVTKDTLIAAAWGGLAIEDSNLPVQIAALRRVLAEESGGESWIETLPRRGYRFAGPPVALEEGRTTSSAVAHATQASGHQDQPSIAVLPFVNLSGNPDQQHFGDAIANDIITSLTRFRWFFVVARQSSFAFRDSAIDVRQIASQLGVRYVLEGSHRQAGQRVRITAQLIDAATGSHLWADRYERDLADIFAIQDDIADCVVGAIEPELLKTESRQSAARAGDLTARDLVRRGVWYFHHVAPETHGKARDLFRAAAKREPHSPDPHIWLARVSGGIALWGWSDDAASVCDEGLAAALTAIGLDEKNPYAHYGLAITSCGANRLEQAERAAEKAIELSPSFALAHLVRGMAMLYLGKAGEAKSALQHGLRLNAHDPHNFVWFDLLALAHLFTDETRPAVTAATQALKIRPASQLTLQVMAICDAASGRTDEARRCVGAALEISAHPIAILAPLRARNPQWSQEIDRLLRQASCNSN